MLSSRVVKALVVALAITAAALASAEPAKTDDSSSDPAWKVRFDEICGVVAAAGDLTIPELQDYISQANALITEIKGLDIAGRNVYVFRLDKCIKFFQYTIDLKERDKAKPKQ